MGNFVKDCNELLEMYSDDENAKPLTIIISDGRLNKQKVKPHIIEAQSKGLVYIFIIIENTGKKLNEK
jgi:hypothetical protein